MAKPVEMQFGMCTCGAQETRVLGGCPGRGTFGSNTCPDLSAVDILNLNRNRSAAKQSLATSTPS